MLGLQIAFLRKKAICAPNIEKSFCVFLSSYHTRSAHFVEICR